MTRNLYQAHYYRVMQNYELYPIVIRELLLSCFTCYNALGSSEQPVTSGCDQINFRAFTIVIDAKWLPGLLYINRPVFLRATGC